LPLKKPGFWQGENEPPPSRSAKVRERKSENFIVLGLTEAGILRYLVIVGKCAGI
jgi:hypothetical protein